MQITKAMELVASSKLRRAKTRAEDARPFFDELYAIMCRTAGLTKGLDTVYAAKREIKNRLYIVIAGDRGLAGGYNSNILKLADGRWTDDGIKPKIIAIGKKSVEFFSKRGYELIGEYPGLSEYIKVADAADIAQTATDMFLKHEADEIVLFFTQFVSPLVQNPIAMPVLPIIAPVGSLDKPNSSQVTYDPSPDAVFGRIIPRMITSLIVCAVNESYASELGARRTAMENATDNAQEMIDTLSLAYNRARQEKITNELNEIVSGANAL